jgi:cytochrome P450
MKTILPPGPRGHFLLGNLSEMQQSRLAFITQNAREFGDIVTFRVGPRRIFQLNHPDYIRYVLVEHPEQFHKTPRLKQATAAAIGQGLLTSDGEFHTRQRRLVQPAFHHKRIAGYAEAMVRLTSEMLAEWRDGQTVELHQEMMKLTMRIIAKTMFDYEVAGQADALGEAISLGIETTAKRITRVATILDHLPTDENRKWAESRKLLKSTILDMIETRRREGEDKGDLLSMLLLAVDEADGGQMTNQQVMDEAMTLFIAGHETTANALTWAFYLLAQHPQVEERLRQEIRDAVGDAPITLKDLARMPYALMVVNEVLRMYPPAWTSMRHAQETFELGGYTIPAGSFIMLPIYALHHHPRYWNEPEAFIPDRFDPAREQEITKYMFLPFGAGPRVCIGNQFALMEAQLVLATMVQQYHLEMVSDAPVEMEPLVTLRAKGGIPMRATAVVQEPLATLVPA